MSHLFCTSTAKGIEIVKSLGEEDWRITQSGILSYEDMKKINNKDQQKIMKELNLSFSIPIILVTVHPIPKDIQQTKNEALNIFKALMKVSKNIDVKIIITSPNDDKGSEVIKKVIKEYLPLISNSCFFESLGGYRYQTIMSLAKHMPIILCGNSSSVIKEAPFFGAHSLNIGTRQNGREFASSQVNCPADEYEIFDSIKYLLNKKITENFNPYFQEEPSVRIVEFIKNIYKRKSKSEILNKSWRKNHK